MSKEAPGPRPFTFVDYNLNQRGVTDVARAHLMKDRVRSKREARSEWISRNQFSPLRWMRPKKGNGESSPDSIHESLNRVGESTGIASRPMSHYAAVIDFQKDKVINAPLSKGMHPVSPIPPKSDKRLKARRVRSYDGFSRRRSSVRREESLPEQPQQQATRPASRSRQPEMFKDPANMEDGELQPGSATKRRRRSQRSDSDFKLSLIEGLRIATPPNDDDQGLVPPRLDNEASNDMYAKLASIARRALLPPTALESHLIRYFVANAGGMLGFDRHQEIVEKYEPVVGLFLPFALASQWCFETMVLLFSAYHHRKYASSRRDAGFIDEEKEYMASQQNKILATTRSKVSALAHSKDSSDEDVVAFLFLALSEYCAGNRDIGLMHFEAWRKYCEMRRQLGIEACGLPCKTVVWWCTSMLVEDDVVLGSLLSPVTKAKVREEPEKLFKYFVKYTEGGEGIESKGPAALHKNITQ
ncbi:hypothetical protein PV08_10162 [Exophiala spinifera]|uniref:Uncharacterized protein n=1 Tax=Exophiala spinifera TaxID=91928 RepID=A0A0D2AVU6_9EURO|nr:uncharacterized protein PV08_10162 [Exophiala spinifera]KIW10863.1 hypothetical protein PV08_10162 [Exophiala spinifera]